MPRPVSPTKQLAAASANNIALSQSLAAAGALTLNGSAVSGGVATLDTQRRVLITSAGNDSGLTWTVTGTNGAGVAISESLAGGNTTAVATQQDFLTVSSVAASGATASTVTVGTNSVGSTQWFLPDQYLTPFSLGVDLKLVSGTANFSFEITFDDPRPQPNPIIQVGGSPYAVPVIPTPVAYTALNNLSTSTSAFISDSPFMAWRLTVNSGTGLVQARVVQSGLVQ
jgi:hypothetical protein